MQGVVSKIKFKQVGECSRLEGILLKVIPGNQGILEVNRRIPGTSFNHVLRGEIFSSCSGQ